MSLIFGLSFYGQKCCFGQEQRPAGAANAVFPNGSPDEPLLEELSLVKAAASLDRTAVAWVRKNQCGSCHTGWPYLYSRAVLPAAPGDSLAEVRAFFEGRIANWDADELVKKHQHREIVGTAAALAMHDAQSTGKLQAVTRQALDRMWTLQRKDGAWSWPKCSWPPFEVDDYYGAVLAAVGTGHAPENYAQSDAAKAGVGRLRNYLKKTPAPNLHHRAWLLWAAVRLDGLLGEEEKQDTIRDLLALQRGDGGWSMESLGQDWTGREGEHADPAAPSDGYGTGLVVLVLREAGLPTGHAALQRGVKWLSTNQRESGRWFTRSLNGVPQNFISDTATAFAVLALQAAPPAATSNLHGAAPGSATAGLQVVAVLRDEAALAGAHDIEVRDGLAYIAGKGFTRRNLPTGGVYPYEPGRGGALAIVDVKQPAAPQVLWFANTPLAYEDAETVLPLENNRLLVGTRDLFLFDVSDSAQPQRLAVVRDRPKVDTINGFARHGDAVFAANKQGHLVAVDVSLPDTIKIIGTRETRASGELGWPHDVALCGGLLVVVSPEGFGDNGQPGKLAVYRVIDRDTDRPLPAAEWTLVGKLQHARLAGANRVRTRGKLAYVGSSLRTGVVRTDDLRPNVAVIDLSNPAAPRLRGSIDHPQGGSNGLAIVGDVVFAAGGQTVQALDVSNPDTLQELARFTSAETFPGSQDDAHDLVYHDGHLFVTAQTSHSLVILKLSEKLLGHLR